MRLIDRNEKESIIIQAAIVSFAKSGYEKTSIAEIAAGAGIATGGIYNYFKNKLSLFESCCTHIYDRFTQGLDEALQQGSKVYQAVLFSLRFFKKNIDYARILLLEAKNFSIRFPEAGLMDQWHDRFVDHIKSAMDNELKLSNKGAYGFYVTLMVGGIESILLTWLFKPNSIKMSEESIALELARIARLG